MFKPLVSFRPLLVSCAKRPTASFRFLSSNVRPIARTWNVNKNAGFFTRSSRPLSTSTITTQPISWQRLAFTAVRTRLKWQGSQIDVFRLVSLAPLSLLRLPSTEKRGMGSLLRNKSTFMRALCIQAEDSCSQL